jgi:uncharacterized membrane protein YtjA (UPF0391 family)
MYFSKVISKKIYQTNQHGGASITPWHAYLKHLLKNTVMLRWALIFFIVAIVAAIFGFTGIAVASAEVAKILFYIFLVLFLLALILGGTLFRKR